MPKLTDVESHFAFGKNWRSYSNLINEDRISHAEAALHRLVGDLDGKSFIDIGCGSGLHALAAGRLGASSITAIDIDQDAVSTTTRVLENTVTPHEVLQVSVFDLPRAWAQRFDVVYSWGVLHHTGAMYRALADAADLVKPEGIFAFALYRKTPLCGFWKIEKRIYSRSPAAIQKAARGLYAAAVAVRLRRSFLARLRRADRGMEFWHDVHDWLGGYPYESISPRQVHAYMQSLNFTLQREFVTKPGLGLAGSGCDEYVYARRGRAA